MQDPINLFRRLLRIAFYALVAATLVCWLLSRYGHLEARYWVYCGLGAIGCSLIRFFTRFM